MTAMLVVLLTLLARLHLRRFRPIIIGITGSAGKTTTKDAVASVLATKFRVRSTGGNLNNELGMPATIIGDFAPRYYRTGGTFRFWSSVLWRGLWGWMAPSSSYPEALVLEYGADRPGDIAKLAGRFRPQIAIITLVGEVPVHVEFYASAQEVAAEKGRLIEALPATGTAILNGDDVTVLALRRRSPCAVVTYGLSEGAEVQAEDLVTDAEGVRFTLSASGASMPVRIRGTVGAGMARAAAAAAAVGRAFGVGLASSSEALSRLSPPPGRMRLLEGIKGSVIIDDTYNSSPAAAHLALDTLASFRGRRLAVLGDMRELGKHSVQAHQAIGTKAAAVADELFCIGNESRLVADAAKNQLSPAAVHWFEDAVTAAPFVQRILRSGDVVLVKGSQGMRMERIVREIMAEPGRAGELLVRQSRGWLAK
jgi:UDP-N-acetylmuramoyl-tripeptide--D-alanyl-D-alanine ligase